MGLLNCQRGYQQVLERGAGQHLMQTRIVWIEMPDRQCLRGQYRYSEARSVCGCALIGLHRGCVLWN